MESTSQQKIYYSIGEVAELLDVNPSLLRYWEQQFEELKPRRSKGGTRYFTREDIIVLRAIQSMLKEQGMTIKGAKDKLREKNHGEKAKARTIMLLQEVKVLLLKVKDSLDKEDQ